MSTHKKKIGLANAWEYDETKYKYWVGSWEAAGFEHCDAVLMARNEMMEYVERQKIIAPQRWSEFIYA